MKIILWLLILLEAFLVFLIVAPSSIRVQSHAKAFVNRTNNPTQENERIWQEEHDKFKRQRNIMYGSLAGVALINLGAIVCVGRKVKKKA